MLHKLNEMWKARLQDNYENRFDIWEKYDETYGLAERLGFKSAKEAWDANPIIQGSVDPKDFKVVKSFRLYPKKKRYDPSSDWKMRQANDDTFKEKKNLKEDEARYITKLKRDLRYVEQKIDNGMKDAVNMNFVSASKFFEEAGQYLQGIALDMDDLNDELKRQKEYR
jgi:hypothetical protein